MALRFMSLYLRILSTTIHPYLMLHYMNRKKSLRHVKLAAWNKIIQLFNDPLHRQTDTE